MSLSLSIYIYIYIETKRIFFLYLWILGWWIISSSVCGLAVRTSGIGLRASCDRRFGVLESQAETRVLRIPNLGKGLIGSALMGSLQM